MSLSSQNVVAPGSVRPPNQSLIGPLLPLVEEMKDALSSAAATLEATPAWDGAEVTHEDLLASVDELRATADEWQRALLSRLQALWMDQSREYNEYRKKIDRTLRQRHIAELDCMFPLLRTTAVDAEGAVRATNDEVERANIRHMIAHGFRYEREAEGATGKLSALCVRQLEERSVFDRTVNAHSEQLLDAKRADLQRLRVIISKTLDRVEAVSRQVEHKIAASQRAPTHAIYRRHIAGNGSAPSRDKEANALPSGLTANALSAASAASHQPVPPAL